MGNNIKNYLKENTKNSSLRLSMFIQTVAIAVVIITIAFHVFWKTITEGTINWTGLSLIFPAIGTFVGAWIYGKVSQKKIEYGHTENSTASNNDSTNMDKPKELSKK